MSKFIEELALMSGVDKTRLHAVELFKEYVYKFFSTKEEVDKIAVSDFIVAYEVPEPSVYHRHAKKDDYLPRHQQEDSDEDKDCTTLGLVLLHRRGQVGFGSAGLFGTPRMFTFGETPTNRMVHAEVLACVRGLLGEAWEGSLCMEKVDSQGKAKSRGLMSGHYASSYYGGSSGSSAAQDSAGWIPEDDELFSVALDELVVHIALDWPKTCPDFTDHGRLEFDVTKTHPPT